MKVHWVPAALVVAITALAAPLAEVGAEVDPPKERADYLIITADSLAPAAKEWADYRAKQGRKVGLKKLSEIAATWGRERATITDIKNTIKDEAGEAVSDAFSVLLIGDCPPTPAKGVEGEQAYDPKIEIPWFVTTFKDIQGTLIAGDNFYADLIDKKDDLPEVAVGRIPARTVEEVRLALAKVKAYENAKYGEWVKRLTFFAGEGRYGAFIDNMIEAAFTQFADQHVDNAYDVRMTYANLSSPYAWIPSKFSEKVIEEANMGSLLLTYLGHGSFDRLDDFHVKVGNKAATYPILKADDVGKFAIKDGQLPVMLIIACDTGWLDTGADRRCLAERILFADNAPVAVVASSRNSHPYSNMIVQKGIVQGIANKKHATLGGAFLYMKRELMLAEEPDRGQLEDMAALLMPKKTDRDAQNRSHLFLYNLCGDPGLRLRHPNLSLNATALSDSMTIGADEPTQIMVNFGPGLSYSPPADPAFADQVGAYLSLRRAMLKDGVSKVNVADLNGADREAQAAAEKSISANHQIANDKACYKLGWDSIGARKGELKQATVMARANNTLAPGEYLVKIFALDPKGEKCGFAAIPLKVVKKE